MSSSAAWFLLQPTTTMNISTTKTNINMMSSTQNRPETGKNIITDATN
jgi:hypothetical protein